MGYNWSPCPIGTGSDLRGRPLRYLVITLLADAGRPLSIPELVAGCTAEGLVFDGRASKIISDALRWELRSGRVIRVRRGVYRLGVVPRSTMYWIRGRTDQTRHWLHLVEDPDQSPGTDTPIWSDESWVRPWPYWPTTAA